MRVFIAGATGVVGRRAAAQYVAAGHDVTGVTRDERGDAIVREAGGSPVRVDLFDADAVARAVEGHGVVVNLATNIPTGARAALPSAWETTQRLRREAAGHLVDGAIAAGARRCIQESLAFMYIDGGDRWLDEDAPLDPHPIQAATLDAEAHVDRLTAAGGAGVALRFGFFYAADAAHTRDELQLARRRFATSVGDPDGYRPVVHLDDAAAAVVAALEVPAGVYNVVDDEPLTRREHAEVLGDLLGVGRLRLPPAFLGKLPMLSAVSRSHRVSNARFRRASSWRPRYPSAREGWAAVVRASEAEDDAT